MVRVVDASAIAAMLFGEPDGPWVYRSIARHMLIAPSIFHFELGNICWVKSRRYPDQAAAALNAWLDWNAEPPLTAMATDLIATMELARGHDLTFYDASYLWLAQTQQTDLISLDAKLVRAACKIGIQAPSPKE
jgi:predicted nucleic acid-binding protein